MTKDEANKEIDELTKKLAENGFMDAAVVTSLARLILMTEYNDELYNEIISTHKEWLYRTSKEIAARN